MQHCIGKTESVTADEVAMLTSEIEELSSHLEGLTKIRNEKALALYESGDNMITSDGRRVIVDTGGRREVLPEMVESKYPDVYEVIRMTKMASFKPRIGIKDLEEHLGKRDIDDLVVERSTAPRVRVR
jgi:hypothetical protein